VDSEQLIIDAANRGIGLAGSGEFIYGMTVNVLKLMGRDFAAQLRPGDRPSILLVCDVEVDGGKGNPGAVLCLEDRIVLAWMKGTFRPTTEIRVVPLVDVVGLTRTTRTGSRARGDRTLLSFSSRQGATTLVLYSPKMEEAAVFTTEGILSGAITFTWGEDEPEAEGAEPEPIA
jgi:hypothetical protein